METIEVSKEDYEFLKDLQHELLTQENDGNADPLYWGVMERKETGVPDGCGDDYKVVCSGNSYDREGFIEHINEYYMDDSKDENLCYEWEHVDKESIDDMVLFYNAKLADEDYAYAIDVREEDVLTTTTGAFLTKRACKEYIEKYGYNHTKPRTYAMTAYRNYEYERLLNILKTMKLC